MREVPLMTVQYLFTEYVKKELASNLVYEQDERASADYDVELSFSQEVATQRVKDARRFLERIRSFLQTEGLDEVIPA